MRISLVGVGRWGRNILRDLLALGADVAVADIDSEARRYAANSGIRQVTDSIDDLPVNDGIVIATPTSTHAMVVRQALARGVPVFVEKPLTNDVTEARMLAEGAQGRLFVMDKWRYHPGIEELGRIAKTGELGQPLGMHLRHVGWGLAHHDVDVIWILLPHCLSIFFEVFGGLPPVSHAFAERLGGNTIALSGSLEGKPWATFEVSARSPAKRREFRLHCEDGVAWLDEGWAEHISIVRGEQGSGGDAGDVEKRTISTELPLLRELRAFAEHLRGGAPPRSSAEEGALIVSRVHDLRVLAGM